VSMKTE